MSNPASLNERSASTPWIVVAAIALFAGTAFVALPRVVTALMGTGLGPERMMVNALLLNIALLLFSWHRYRRFNDELHARRRAELEAKRLAETDPLTGCLNRRGLTTTSVTVLRVAAEHGEYRAVLMFDIDNFKQINDMNGHSAGDLILLECVHRVQSILPPSALFARIGGDEFAILVTFDPRNAATIDALAAQIVNRIATPVMCNGIQIDVSASVGVVRSDQRRGIDIDLVEDEMSVLMHMADIAMYHAKKEGRNRYYWFEPPMEDELRFRKALESGIRQGIPRGEFVPYYEQQIDLQTGTLTGFEMLARWRSPDLGDVSPEVFIPIAEEIGAISELSESVIAQALVDARDWDPNLSLAVNISPYQLRDPWFAQRLLKMLVVANFPPSRLEIEITETCLHENIGLVRSLIASLKNQGIRISLDDFGTGYSSLAQLRNLPFDRLKIDRSFVTSLNANADSAAIVHAIALLGRGLGLPVTVEGIENEEILNVLRQYGDIKGQGYLYGRPQSAEQTLARINHRDDDPEQPGTPKSAIG